MSSYSKNIHIVFLDLPKDIAFKIDKIRSKYSHSYKKYPAHITLKQDEDFIIKAKEICAIVYENIKNQRPLSIELKSPNVLINKSGWNIYLPVKSKNLANLVKKISKALQDFIDPKSPRAFLSTKWEQSDKFYTHVSIKGGRKTEDHRDLLEKIKKEKFDFNFPQNIKCDEITVANWQNSKWKKIKTFKLKNV